jgi:hypothetical protein
MAGGSSSAEQTLMVRLSDVEARAEFLNQEVRSAPGDRPSTPDALVAELAPLMKTLPDLIQQLTKATDRAARAEAKVDFLGEQVTDLKQRLESADRPPPPPLLDRSRQERPDPGTK